VLSKNIISRVKREARQKFQSIPFSKDVPPIFQNNMRGKNI